jgi:ribonuclease P protein component
VMQKMCRLTKGDDFLAVRRMGKSYPDRLLVLLALRNTLTDTRVGLSVSRRVGNAVQRNRIKRMLREVFRASVLMQGWDLVVIARHDAVKVDFIKLNVSATTLLRRAGVLLS